MIHVFHQFYRLFSFTEVFFFSFFACITQVHMDAVQAFVLDTAPESLSLFLPDAYRKDFEELFDVIITNALKPGFFSLVPQQRPFRTLGECRLTLLVSPLHVPTKSSISTMHSAHN